MTHQMTLLAKGRYVARIAETAGDLQAAQALRGACFSTDGPDADRFDSLCRHILIEEKASGRLMCCFRMLVLQHAHQIAESYSAQFYDLAALGSVQGGCAEVGRFCIREGVIADPDILRMAWGAITAIVDAENLQLLFGCSSFKGTDVTPYIDSFNLLKARHLAPLPLRPRIKAPMVFGFCDLPCQAPDLRAGMRAMPPLLRTYLLMGGWVSDHAVVDEALNTLHVFTAVEVDAIPETRKRLLRAVAETA
ncbi:GNAT family N-acetyltransferase [Phycobacter azelaicus]|uniref:GNAT family N-acetyltransferase n=1 Tax=Phycobacter azelaicus TaxID=2668075 RepID=UPI001D00E946|nr:GNAT family N-acyltransferase [Phycobacter azelaicus]